MRKPRLRASYGADGQYLLRLAQAVGADTTRPPEWRRSVIDSLQDLAGRFLSGTPEEKEAETEGPADVEAGVRGKAKEATPGIGGSKGFRRKPVTGNPG